MIGTSFVEFFSNYGFEKILKVAGRNFRDFLYSIDQLHDSNRFTFPKMKSPLFFVESEDKRGAFLHYQSVLIFLIFNNIFCYIRIILDLEEEDSTIMLLAN